MQIEIFTLCDSANTYAGKTVISGAFNQVTVKELPYKSQNMTLAVRVSFEKEERGDKTFYFTIKNPDGTLLIPELRCETKQNVPIEKQSPIITLDLSLVLGNISLAQYGQYVITMKLDNKEYFFHFYLLQGK